MSWVATAVGVGVGGLTYGVGKLTQKKRTMPTPVEVKMPQLTDYPTGKSVNDRILAALNQGSGIGFPADYMDKTTSPFIAERQAGWDLREKPALEASYGARGLSRSTLAGRDIGQAYAQKERDINSIIADAYLKNELQKKTDTARYENLGYNFAGAEAGIGGQNALQNAGIQNQFNLGALQLQQQADAANQANINQAIGAGFTVGNATYQNNQMNDLRNLFRQEQSRRSATPFVTAHSYGA